MLNYNHFYTEHQKRISDFSEAIKNNDLPKEGCFLSSGIHAYSDDSLYVDEAGNIVSTIKYGPLPKFDYAKKIPVLERIGCKIEIFRRGPVSESEADFFAIMSNVIGHIEIAPDADWPEDTAYYYGLKYMSDYDLSASIELIRSWHRAHVVRFIDKAQFEEWESESTLHREITYEIAKRIVGRFPSLMVETFPHPIINECQKRADHRQQQRRALEDAHIRIKF